MDRPITGNLTDDVVANAHEHGSEVAFSRPGAKLIEVVVSNSVN